MEKPLFTSGNIGKFFTTSTDGLPGNQASLVKTIGQGYHASAVAVLNSTPIELAQPIVGEMYGSYARNVGLIVHGWAGNA